jgi:hypothetical protein
MLNQNDFLGGLGNLEGSILIGIVSIVYSLAIAIIPFIAKRIVSGDVGSTAAAMVATAVTALTAGAAAVEGAAAGVAAAGAGSSGGAASGTSGAATAGSARALTASAGGNQPAPPQRTSIAANSGSGGSGLQDGGLQHGSPTLEGHADQIRSSMSDVMGRDAMGADNSSEEGSGALAVPAEGSGTSQGQSTVATARPSAASRSSAQARRGPSVHRYNLGTWSAYHAARIAARSLAGAAKNED